MPTKTRKNRTRTSIDIIELRVALIRKGLSISEFARRHGWNHHTVLAVVRRYGRGRFQRPWGPLALKIIATLHQEIGVVSQETTEEG